MTTKPEGRCSNPRCSCSPCTCEDCRCGGARLGDLERRVMAVLWSDPGIELSGRDIADKLPEYAYTTIATVLDRLSNKGEVRRRSVHRRAHYSATRSGSQHAAHAMREILENASDPVAALRDVMVGLPAEQREDVMRAVANETDP